MSRTHGSHPAAAVSTDIVWFRRDLRLSDNPAWAGAINARRRVCALFVLDPILLSQPGDHRRRLLFAHLHELDRSLRMLGGRLRIESGDPTVVVPRLAADLASTAVFWNGDTTPYARRRDRVVAEATGAQAVITWGTLVHPPGSILTKGGSVSLVFTPFHNAWDQRAWDRWPTIEHAGTVEVTDDPGGGLPAIDGEPPEEPGERGALAQLTEFAQHADNYLTERLVPSIDGTSRLSAHLRFGTVSPRRVAAEIGTQTSGRAGFVRQLAWRDWFAHLFVEHPHLRSRPLRPESGEIEWLDHTDEFEAWTAGATGYPIIDAGMRELSATGRMHNRVRMLCASFLVKDLLIDWRRGERWFRQLLIDGDVAQNVGNWQWAAGTGPDAAPFFRVFNPTLQSRKFDPNGRYIRRWIPELAALDDHQIHEPAASGPLALAANGVVLGAEYPWPIVDHSFARQRALAAYGAARADSTM